MLDKNLSHLLSSNMLGIRFVGSQAVQGKQRGRIQSSNHLSFIFSNSTPEPYLDIAGDIVWATVYSNTEFHLNR